MIFGGLTPENGRARMGSPSYTNLRWKKRRPACAIRLGVFDWVVVGLPKRAVSFVNKGMPGYPFHLHESRIAFGLAVAV